MGSLPVTGWQPLSDAGAIMAGAKAYFYETGASTTPKNTYSNKALSSANANPVVADANGRFGSIFLMQDAGYRLVLKTSADVTVFTKDEIYADAFAVDELVRRRLVVRSPIDNGAVGDGSTNDAVAVQAAIDSGAKTVDLEGKTFKINAGLTAVAGLTIQNGVLDFTDSTSDNCISVTGSEGSEILLTGNVAAGDEVIAVASLGTIAVGDALRLYDSVNGSEIVYVSSIASLNVTLKGAVKMAHTTANSAAVREITPMSRVTLRNVRIIGDSGRTYAAVYAENASQVTLDNVQLQAITYGAYFYRSMGLTMSRVTFNATGLTLGVGDLIYGYDSRDILATDIDMQGGHAVFQGQENTIGVIIGKATVSGAMALAVSQDSSSTYQELSLIDCTLRTVNATTVNHAVGVVNTTLRMAGCKFTGGDNGGVSWSSTSAMAHSLSMTDCSIVGEDDALAISVSGSGTVGDISVRGGRLQSTVARYGINLSTSVSLSALRLEGVYIAATASFNAMSIVGTGSAVITGLAVTDCFISQGSTPNAVVLTGAAANGILGASFKGCTISGGTYGIAQTNSTDVAVDACYFTGQVTADLSGVFKVDGQYMTSVSITATEIVGTAAGDLGHASGVTLVAAVAGKIIEPISVIVNFTASGQYGDGAGNLFAKYDGGSAATGVLATLVTVGAATSNIATFRALTGASLVNTKLVLVASAAMTAGTGAGTAVIKTYYRLLAA